MSETQKERAAAMPNSYHNAEALPEQPPALYRPPKRPFFPRVSRLNPAHYQGDRWAIDGRASERYTAKKWRMVMHVLHATVFG